MQLEVRLQCIYIYISNHPKWFGVLTISYTLVQFVQFQVNRLPMTYAMGFIAHVIST